MFQKVLPKVNIICYTEKRKYRFLQSSWSGYFREEKDYPKLLLNDKWLIEPSIIIDNED